MGGKARENTPSQNLGLAGLGQGANDHLGEVIEIDHENPPT
jgi:hypothetical protein